MEERVDGITISLSLFPTCQTERNFRYIVPLSTRIHSWYSQWKVKEPKTILIYLNKSKRYQACDTVKNILEDMGLSTLTTLMQNWDSNVVHSKFNFSKRFERGKKN